MGVNNCCSSYRLSDDPFLQMQLVYCSDEIKSLRNKVNQADGNDINKIYKFGNWDAQYGMTGVGIIYLPRNYYYDGGIRKGNAHGTGRIVWINDDHYRGDLSNGKASGIGKFQCPRKAIKYQGEWIDGHPSKGQLFYNNTQNQVYFNKDKKLTIKLPDGIVYSGDVILRNFEYIIDGNGRMTFTDGSFYEGNFKEGHMHGRGEFVWKTGQKYKGDYHIGTKEGFGTYYYSKNKWYEGLWEDGRQNGEGSIYVNGQRVFFGRWKNGAPEIYQKGY